MRYRQFTATELNHLIKYKKATEDLSEYGEMPVEYITGFADFCGREFIVTPDTLIPRLETETLIQISLKSIAARYKPGSSLHIVDVGTGTGCIGITLFLELKKKYLPKISLIDVSDKVLQTAQLNVDKLIPEESKKSITLKESNLLSQFDNNTKIDVIVANLPYIPSNRIADLEQSVKNFEPLIALNGGEDGLDKIRQLLNQVQSFKQLPQFILLEADHTINRITKIKVDGYKTELVKDQFGKNRFLIYSLIK